MFRVDTSTAAPVEPAQLPVGQPGYFSIGDPNSGTLATEPGQDWFNIVQEELMAIVANAGITPEKNVTNQVLTAIQDMIAAATGGVASVPSGAVFHFAAVAAPAGYLECNGALVSRTTYAMLFAAIGTTFGAGDGSTTFGLPDLRGEFVRGFDHGRGIDPGRGFGTAQTDAMQGHLHGPPAGAADYRVYQPGGTTDSNGGGSNYYAVNTGGPVNDGTNGAPRTTAETRPVNVALLPCIKT